MRELTLSFLAANDDVHDIHGLDLVELGLRGFPKGETPRAGPARKGGRDAIGLGLVARATVAHWAIRWRLITRAGGCLATVGTPIVGLNAAFADDSQPILGITQLLR